MHALFPWLLVLLRTLLCPLIVYGARADWRGSILAAIVIIALVSDIYDGVLARRWGVETAQLRVADSLADTVFYVGVAAALWRLQPGLFRANVGWFAGLFSLEAIRYVFDWIKYRKTASYHSYLAKCWGLVLAVAMVSVFLFNSGALLVRLALAVGILVNLEGIVMSLLLPDWKNDVKTVGIAWRLRQAMLADK